MGAAGFVLAAGAWPLADGVGSGCSVVTGLGASAGAGAAGVNPEIPGIGRLGRCGGEKSLVADRR